MSHPTAEFMGRAFAIFLVLALIALGKSLFKGLMRKLDARHIRSITPEFRARLELLSSDTTDEVQQEMFRLAQEGRLDAIDSLGSSYRKGYCVEKDRSKAMEIYREAAGLGSKHAARALDSLSREELEAPLVCPQCGQRYSPDDYREDAEQILCSNCHTELPKR